MSKQALILVADKFTLKLTTRNNPFSQRVIDISAGLMSSSYVVGSFLLNFEAVRLDKLGVEFGFIVKASLTIDLASLNIREVAKVPTSSLIDSPGDWNMVIEDADSVSRFVARKIS